LTARKINRLLTKTKDPRGEQAEAKGTLGGGGILMIKLYFHEQERTEEVRKGKEKGQRSPRNSDEFAGESKNPKKIRKRGKASVGVLGKEKVG